MMLTAGIGRIERVLTDNAWHYRKSFAWRDAPGPFPPRSRTTFNNLSHCRIRRRVNVSTHNVAALNSPPLQGKCPEHSVLQHALVQRILCPLPRPHRSREGTSATRRDPRQPPRAHPAVAAPLAPS